MREWFELGKKIGCIEMAKKFCDIPNMFIGPHDVENIHYEIIDDLNAIGLDNSLFLDLEIDKYADTALKLITSPNKTMKKQLFLLGFYSNKLRMLMINDLDKIGGNNRKRLLKYLSDMIDQLKLPKSLKKISIIVYREQDFEKIERAVLHDNRFDQDDDKGKSKSDNKNFKIEMTVAIVIGLITAAATIIAAIIG